MVSENMSLTQIIEDKLWQIRWDEQPMSLPRMRETAEDIITTVRQSVIIDMLQSSMEE